MLGRLLFALGCCLPLVCSGFDTSYWAWHYNGGFAGPVGAALHAQKVTKIYCYAGELENSGAEWKWKTPFVPQANREGLEFVPVVRITSVGKTPFSDASVAALVEKLSQAAAAGGASMQIDFDCPDRLLGEYAQALKKLHTQIPHLSITAHAGWCKSPAWTELQSSVDEIFPMFYDMDLESDFRASAPQALLDPKKSPGQIGAWAACKIPWYAGLPTFARITVVDTTGRSRGSIRQWGWDDICFNSCLTSVGPTAEGVTVMRVEKDGVVAETPVKRGEMLVVRWPDRAALAPALEAARNAHAAGVVYFRLPDSADSSGWSLPQIAQIAQGAPQGAPHLVLREKSPGVLTLVNDSSTDLEPVLSGETRQHGYALEIDAPAPVFRDASAGDFWKVTGYATPEARPHLVSIPLATRLTFWFSHLRAGESLDCGLIRLAPNAALKQIRYRVLPEKTWHSIE